MTDAPGIIIENHQQFLQTYQTLTPGSVICGNLRLLAGEEHLLVDLLARGVILIPSASCQLASRSKVYQSRVFNEYMVPHTRAIYDTNGLLETLSRFHRLAIGKVVVKQDRKDGGTGIHRFSNIEDVYNMASFGKLDMPFVVQPYIEAFTDIRVIILADYQEAYERRNPANFRRNLHCGGEASAWHMDENLGQFCREVMQRGEFPYAFLDIMITEDNSYYLSEITLRGGLRGAVIDGDTYRRRVSEIHAHLAAKCKEQ